MTPILGLVISCLALAISAITAWLTLFHRGTIKMTQPTVVFFGPDGDIKGNPKVFLRTLLYSTSKRGQIVESMFVKLRRRESVQNFNIWVYGEGGSSPLVRGSGLYVGHEGVAHNHHFLLPKDGTGYEFLEGDYQVEVYVKLVNSRQSKPLWNLDIILSGQQSDAIKNQGAGIYFDWSSDSKTYHPHIDLGPAKGDLNLEFFTALKKKRKTP